MTDIDTDAPIDDLTPEQIDRAITKYANFELTSGDLEKLGIDHYGDIIAHLTRLGLKIPNVPIEAETPEVQALRRRGIANLEKRLAAKRTSM